MIKKLLFALLISFSFYQVQAQCAENDETKVLLIGDSWAFFMGVDGTFNNVFEKWGHSDKKFTTNIEVAVNGARTTDFLDPNMQTEIQDIITNNPSIEVIHLSIAGNDVLGQWDINFTQGQLDTLIDEVYTQTLDILAFLKSTRPGIKIVFSGYCYPNFEEVLTVNNPLQNSHPFYGQWESMDFPTFLQINTLLNDFSLLVEAYVDTDPQIEFFKATGLMQHTFGQNSALGVAPGGSYAPFTQPMPFGDPSYPSPQNSMRDYLGITRDCFHLSPKGYRDLIGYHTQKFYQKFLMDDQYLISSSTNNGNVSSLLNSYSDLLIGLSAGEEFGTLVEFETQDMNWEYVEKAEIFLNISELVGTNPLDQALELSIKSGSIGTSAAAEGSDWNASVDLTATPCVFGKNDGPGDWIRIELPSSFLPILKSQNNTQFLIKGTAITDGVVTFSGSQDPEFAPVLNLKYDEEYVGIRERNDASHLSIFPNPANNFLTITSDKGAVESVKFYNAIGALCLEHNGNSAQIDVSNLTPGFYQVLVMIQNEMVVKSFIKN